eukprot:12415378-Karenia_brevis.AAC.1
MRDFQSTLATDSNTDPTVDQSYDRCPDYRLLQLNANKEITPQEFQSVVEEWLANDFKSDQWEVLLDQERKTLKNLTIRFKGPADGTAARRAEKARQLCKST